MKNKKLIAFITSVTVTVVASFSATVAWFNTSIRFGDVEAYVKGYSAGAYFDYGTGKYKDPYGIRTPRHLYNLAWLQYLGQFNNIENGSRKQTYFELAGDIDMTGWTLPPIGTTDYPFIGNFEGNGHTISNLTVSNNFSDYEKTPDVVQNVSGVEIIGLFGVVGSLNAEVTDSNKASVPLTDKIGSAPYNSQVNEIKNTGINAITVSSQTTKTLIGIAAGYVNGNLDGVAVNNSNIAISNSTTSAYDAINLTSNYSDYSLAGYVTDNFKGEIDEKEIKVETPEAEYTNVSASGDNWGNSINFLDSYNRLLREKNTYGTTFTTTYVSGAFYDLDGTTLISGGTQKTLSSHRLNDGFNEEFMITNSKATDKESNQVASYTFYDRTKTTGEDYDNFMYMFGKYDFSVLNEDFKLTEAQTFHTGKEYLFTDGNNHFMVVNNGNLANSNKANIMNYSGFMLDSDGYLTSKYNERTYYLRSNGDNLELDDSSTYADIWTYDPDNEVVYTQYNNYTYFLRYNNGWTNTGIADTTVWDDSNGFKIRFTYDGTSYYLIRNNNGTLGVTTDSSNALYFKKDNNNRFYTKINSTNYYLAGSGNNLTPGLYTASNNLNYLVLSDDGYLRTANKIKNSYYYLKYSNGSFTISANVANGIVIKQISSLNPNYNFSNYRIKLYELENISSGKMHQYSSDPTYFPLSFASTDYSNSDYNTVSENNTGYLVAGANYHTQPGDFRISKYARSNLYVSLNGRSNENASYNNDGSNLNIVTRTANSNGFCLIKDDYNKNNTNMNSSLSNKFGNAASRKWYDNQTGGLNLQKYKDSREHLHELLLSGSYVYGLHFMDAQIQASHKIEIPYAKINRNVFTNYELPEDCIDFNLKRKGYINFFAGTYFTNNTTFFSLYHIVRNENNKLTSNSIKEISKIYINKGTNTDLYPYIYEYANNGGYNVEVSGSSDARLGNLAFDMSWVTSPTMQNYAMYYFEIPANEGEYALGSVENKNGAYLMYLDIGASSKSTDVTTVTERITTIVGTFDYVIGIDFVTNMPKKKDEFGTIDGGDSAHVSIPTSSTGTLNYIYTADAEDNNAKTLTLSGSPFSGTLSSSYASVNSTIYNSITSTELVASAKEEHTTVLDKITTYEYNSQTLNLVTTIASRETVDGVAGLWHEDEPTYSDAESTYQSSLELENTGGVIFIFEYSAPKTAVVTVTTFYNPDTSAYYFTITSNVDITIHITKLVATYNYINDNGVSKTVNYTYYINSETETVSEGDYANITAS